MTTNRRNLLALMGISGAAATISTDALGEPVKGGGGLTLPGPGTNARVAQALRNLADAISRGEVEVQSLKTTSSIEPNNWVSHDVLLSVLVMGDVS